MTMRTFDDTAARIAAAGHFTELETWIGASGLDAYRRLVKIVHPDAAPAGRTATATQAFASLAALWAGPRRLTGDIADLIEQGTTLVKVPRQPADNDLMAAEARALKAVDGNAYMPRLVDSYTHEDAGRKRRTVNVIERQDGFVSLVDVMRAYPDGLDPRDVAWMWRRLLTALGWAHRAGLVHGAVLAPHVLIHPEEHGLVLVDWCYSVAPGTSIPALVSAYRSDYPPEVRAKDPAGPATDIHLATVLMRRLMKDPPPALRRFADGCLYDAPRMRPQDAWALLAEFDELLEDLYGPRRFRPFAMPAPHNGR
jgi:hypothetical protein